MIARTTLGLVTLALCGCGNTAAEDAAPAATVEAGTPERDGSDWPQFLGPDRDGTTPEPLRHADWSAHPPKEAWSRPTGTGYAAPAVLGNRLIVFHRVGDEEITECVRADTGELVWKTAAPSDFSDPYGYNNGPRCAPLLTDGLCVTFGAEGRLRVSDLATGGLKWERPTGEEFDVPRAFFGVGATPVAEDGLLFVPVGGQPDAGLVAMDLRTGETFWEAVGLRTWNGAETDDRRQPAYNWTGDEMVVSYSSPVLATIHGKRHLLLLARQGLVSVDPKTGEENFHYWFRSTTHESVNAACPVVHEDTILLSAPYGVGSALLRVAEDGEAVEELWRVRRGGLEAHWGTPVYRDGHYYGFSGRNESGATLMCVDAQNGSVVWQTSGFEGDPSDLGRESDGWVDRRTGETIPFPFFGRGSLSLCGDRFVAIGERGTLAAFEASPEGYRETGRVAAPGLSYPSWPAPVYSRGRLFLRDEDTLLALDLK